MARKIITAQKLPRDPLHQIYWNCPSKGCPGIQHSFEDDKLLNSDQLCSTCKAQYKIIAIPNSNLASLRLTVEFAGEKE